jgi:hypothetical protein
MVTLYPKSRNRIHDSAPSSHPRALRKTIAEPLGATQILHKPLEYEHGTHSKSSISRFGLCHISLGIRQAFCSILSEKAGQGKHRSEYHQ